MWTYFSGSRNFLANVLRVILFSCRWKLLFSYFLKWREKWIWVWFEYDMSIISFLREEEEWMCFVYSAFWEFPSLAKVKSSRMTWRSCYFKNSFFGIKFSMACINHFCFMKITVMSRFFITISGGLNFTVFTKTREN